MSDSRTGEQPTAAGATPAPGEGQSGGDDRFYRAAANASRDLVFVIDREGVIRYVNPVACALVGRGADDLIGLCSFDFVTPEAAVHLRRAVDQVLTTGLPVHLANRSMLPNRSAAVDAWLTPLRNAVGEVDAVLGVSRDVTAAVEAEKALRESEARYRSVVETSPDAISVTDLDGRLLLSNRGAADMFGFSSVAEFRAAGLSVYDMVVPEDRQRAVDNAARVLQGVAIRNVEYVFLRKDGSSFPGEISVCTLPDAGGSPKAFLGIVRDVTERKRAEVEIRRAQRIEALGLLAAGLAHDFNNILTAILGNISLARIHSGHVFRAVEALEQAEEAVVRAKHLTGQLLAFARGGAPVRKPVSMAALVPEAVGLSLAGSKVRREMVLPAGLWPVEADEGQIVQVLANIVINAAQAMPDGGSIEFSAENVTVAAGDSEPVPPGRYVRVSVVDHGCGIPPENLARVFDPYFTTKGGGSGLGLATSYAIAKNHGGHIALESKVGVGTTVRLLLPASNAAAPTGTRRAVPLPAGKGKVLLVDDDPTIRDVGKRILLELGYVPAVARDGAAAVDLYAEAMRSGAVFDAVILDLTIPGGMGGKETLAKLLEIDPEVRAVVASGYSGDRVMSEAAEHGFRAVMPKPYGTEEFAEALAKVLS